MLDGFAFHPYPETASTPPDVRTPQPALHARSGSRTSNGCRPLLREALGRELPILYSELGIERGDPWWEDAPLQRDTEAAGPVDEPTQADFYRRALELSLPAEDGVVGSARSSTRTTNRRWAGFQSGVYDVDGVV